MACPLGIFCGLAQEIPRQQAEEDLRVLTVQHSGDPKDLSARLRARAYPETAWYNRKVESQKDAWLSLIQAAGTRQ